MFQSIAPQNATHMMLSEILFNMVPDTSNVVPKFNGDSPQLLKFWLNSHFISQAVLGNWTGLNRCAVAILKLEGVRNPLWTEWIVALKIQFSYDLKLFGRNCAIRVCEREDKCVMYLVVKSNLIIEQSPHDVEGPFHWREIRSYR